MTQHLPVRGILSQKLPIILAMLLGMVNMTTANTLSVAVNCKNQLGEAKKISTFMGAGHGVWAIFNSHLAHNLPLTPDHPGIRAWRRAGMRESDFLSLHSIESLSESHTPQNPFITRVSPGNIKVDFTIYDQVMQLITDPTLLNSTPSIYLGPTPKLLSAQPNGSSAYGYMPADNNDPAGKGLKEWEQLVQVIVRNNVEAWGMRGLRYGSVDEPDWPNYGSADEPWNHYIPKLRYYRTEGIEVALPRSIDLFLSTYRAVHAEDKQAKVGSERHGFWKYLDGGYFTLREWLDALRDRNVANPNDQIKPDFMTWQDYHYPGETGNLGDGADYVRKELKEITESDGVTPHFDINTPFSLSDGGGNGSWGCAHYADDRSSEHIASHVASNFIREFRNGSSGRKFTSASYFLFCFLDGSNPDGGEPLVWYNEDWSVVRYTTTYAIFEIMKYLMQQDDKAEAQIVRASADSPLEVMATYSNHLAVVISNFTDKAREAQVTIELPTDYQTKQLRPLIQRVDAIHSNDGKGLEKGIQLDTLTVSEDKKATLTLSNANAIAPFGTVLVRLYS